MGPDKQADAAAFQLQVRGLGIAATRAALLAKQAGADIRDGFEGALGDTLSRLGTDINSVGEAFAALARSVVQSIQRIVAELIAARIVQSIGSVLGSFGGGSGGTVIGSNSVGVAAAAGGYIRGPGSGTSDSIPARLSNGEYVIRAAAVERIGVDALHAINGLRSPIGRPRPGGVQRFADGGLVTGGAGGRSELAATIGLEDGLIVKTLSSRAGEAAQLDFVRKNARAIRAVLGTR